MMVQHLTRRSAMALLASLLLTACGGDDDSTGPSGNTPSNGSFSARIEGSAWSATQIIASVQTGAVTVLSGGNAQHSVGFAFIDNGTGTYTVGAGSPTNGSYIEATTGRMWVANTVGGSGSVTVTTRTADRIAGTFSFVFAPSDPGTTGTKTVTNGAFDVRF